MTAINYPADGEAGSAAVINRGLREALTALGLDPDDVSAPWLTSAGAAALFASLDHNHDSDYAALDHDHAAADIISGVIATARLGSGTADGTTFLRGDQTWATPEGGGGGGDAGGGEAWVHTDFEVWYAAQVGTQAGNAIAGNSLRGVPFVAPARGGTLDRIAYEVTATSATTCRVGLYASKAEGNIYPGELLHDSGDISSGSIGLKESNVDIDLEPGRVYWLAWVGSNTVSIRQFTSTSERERPLMGYPGVVSGGNSNQLVIAHTYGALPDPFTASAARSAGAWPALCYRFSA